MRPYQVTGSAVQISPGEQLVLNPAQIAARKHMVKVGEKLADDAIVVQSLALLTFKVGETIGLNAIPKQAREHLIDMAAAAEASPGSDNPAPESHKSRKR